MNKSVALGAAIIVIGICLGAFGAHGLETALEETLGGIKSKEALSSYHTGVDYQIYHGFGLILLAILSKQLNRTYKVVNWMFLIGILLFSGSIYLLTIRHLFDGESWAAVLGPITPVGGLCFIVGWILVIVKSLRPAQ